MMDQKYAAFAALDPFFAIVMEGMAGEVDGDHYFDAVADDALFVFKYRIPGFPTEIRGRDALMALYAPYGKGTLLHRADALVVHRSHEPGILILEYEVHGTKISSAKLYDNRFISVITIKNRKIAQWRDYMDSLAAFNA